MPDPARLPDKSVTEFLAERIATLDVTQLPSATRRVCEDLLVDVVGLCLAARQEHYVNAALAAWDEDGPCTVLGRAMLRSAAGAAFVNGTAAHGEDFDDTFEGGARCMRAPLSFRRCSLPASATTQAGMRRCAELPSGLRPCAG
jgi:hypothetical protein